MIKYRYTDYVRHCLRFYARYNNPNYYSEEDKIDWKACDDAFKTLSDNDKTIAFAVYGNRDTLADNVYEYCTKNDIEQSVIMDLMCKIEFMVAKQRGLSTGAKLRQYPKGIKET